MCSQDVNAAAALSAPLKLLFHRYLLAGLLSFHSGILQCTTNVFPDAFICIHMRRQAQTLLPLIFQFYFLLFLCGGKAVGASNSRPPSLEKGGLNRVFFSQGEKKVHVCD